MTKSFIPEDATSASPSSSPSSSPYNSLHKPAPLHKKGSIKSFFRLFEHKPKPAPVFRIITDENGTSHSYVGPYELTLKILGHGGNSVVNLGIDTRNNDKVAIKSINVSPGKMRALSNGEILEEVKVMRKLISSGLCRLLDVFMTETYVYLILEYIEGRELFDVVKADKTLPEPRALHLFSQLVTSVAYLHSMGMVHNDLKLENVLVDKDDEITLIDFGHSSSGDTPSFQPGISTLDYVAPEVILYGTTTTASDVWSLGVVLYIMVVGYFPFRGYQEELRKGIVESKPKFPKGAVSRDCKDLIKKMLTKDPKDRITLEAVKRHPWFLSGLDYYNFNSRSTITSQETTD